MSGRDEQLPGLRLAEDLTLPAEAVTETFAILAKRGAGKTYAAAVLVEEMVTTGLPVCVIDPVGVFYGLRSSADGQAPGLPVVILGGQRADLPLPLEAGAAVADLVIDERIPVVLDLSELSKRGQRRLVADFMEQLFRRNRDPLHVVVDEADLFAPQRGGPDLARLLGAYEDLVRRGRARGLGCTSITQRPAVLHKDILSQSEVLIALRMTGTRDVAAIDEWVRLHDTDGQAGVVKASLAALPVGTAWVWSPGWLGLLKRVQIRRRNTFDSSATPKPGQRAAAPDRFAPVDLDRLRTRLATPAATDETDPAALRRQLAQLRRELHAAQARPPERIEVPVLTDQAATLLHESLDQLTAVAASLHRVLERTAPATPHPMLTPGNGKAPEHAPPLRPTPAPTPPPRTAPPVAGSPASPGLKAGARRMLAVLVRHHPMKLTRAQLATLARLRVTGGTFNTYYSILRTRGYLAEHNGLVELTPAGADAGGLPARPEPISGTELRHQWAGVLKAGARTMLDHLLDRYPDPLSRTELATAVALEPSGGTFGTYLSTLRRNGLIDVTGDQVRAAEVFFLPIIPA